MNLATSYYASRKLDRAKHYLVRTSVGAPRFVKCDEACLDLAPDREWIGLGLDDYAPLYTARLEALGLPRIDTLLRSLHTKAEGKAVVLLCFESLAPKNAAKGQFCHRRLFAEWYEHKTGQVVPEL